MVQNTSFVKCDHGVHNAGYDPNYKLLNAVLENMGEIINIHSTKIFPKRGLPELLGLENATFFTVELEVKLTKTLKTHTFWKFRGRELNFSGFLYFNTKIGW